MERKLVALQELAEALDLFGRHDSGQKITKEEVTEDNFAILIDVLKTEIGLPFDFDPNEIFHLLDRDGDGEITPIEMLSVAYRLVRSELDPFQSHCILFSKLSQLTASVRSLDRHLRKLIQTNSAINL